MANEIDIPQLRQLLQKVKDLQEHSNSVSIELDTYALDLPFDAEDRNLDDWLWELINALAEANKALANLNLAIPQGD